MTRAAGEVRVTEGGLPQDTRCGGGGEGLAGGLQQFGNTAGKMEVKGKTASLKLTKVPNSFQVSV